MRRTIEIAAFIALLLVSALCIHAWLASRDEQQRLTSALAAQKQILDSADARERARAEALNASLAEIAKLKRDTQSPAQIVRDLPKYLSLPQPIVLSQPEADATRGQSGAPAKTAPANSQPQNSGAPGKGINAPARQGSPSSQISAAALEKHMPQSPSNLLADNAAQNDSSASECGQQNNSVAGEKSSRASACSSSLAHPPTGGSNAVVPALNQQGTLPAVPPTASSPDCPNPKSGSAQIPAADLKPLYDYVQDCRACQAQLAAAKQDATDTALKIAALTRERDAAITASKGGTFLRRLRRNAFWLAIGAAAGYAAARR